MEILRSHEILLVNLARLVQRELLGHFLSEIKKRQPFKHFGERISSVIGEVHLSDINSVIGQIVVNYVGIITLDVEFEYFSIVLEELFLRFYPASSQLVFQVIHHKRVLFRHEFVHCFVLKVVERALEGVRLRDSQILVKFTSILVTIVYFYAFWKYFHFLTNTEVIYWQESFVVISQNLILFYITFCLLRNIPWGIPLFNYFSSVICKELSSKKKQILICLILSFSMGVSTALSLKYP